MHSANWIISAIIAIIIHPLSTQPPNWQLWCVEPISFTQFYFLICYLNNFSWKNMKKLVYISILLATSVLMDRKYCLDLFKFGKCHQYFFNGWNTSSQKNTTRTDFSHFLMQNSLNKLEIKAQRTCRLKLWWPITRIWSWVLPFLLD